MAIHYLNGRRLKHAIIAGAESVITRKDYLNKINVFPVADGDTGTNMALTLKSVVDGLYECDDSTVDAVVCCAADAALVGSRGNSGSILAQFYQGLYEGLAEKQRITAKEFGSALLLARQYAYESMMQPQEGTILTVIRDWAQSVSELAQRTTDFKQIMAESVAAARLSLARTPDLLKVNGESPLKKAGVVDSGAQGFVDMVGGVVEFISKGSIKEYIKRKFFSVPLDEEAGAMVEYDASAITFQYCTEFVLQNGAAFDKKELRKILLSYGDSLIIGGSSAKTKVHIHTNEPQTVFDIAAKFGIVQKTKFEDMKAQHEQAFGKKPIGIVTDSTCDLSEEYLDAHHVALVPLTIRFDEEEYLDRVTLSSKEFYQKLTLHRTLPKTSQPSTANFKQVYDDVLRRYDTVLGIHLSSGVSGTFQNAKLSSKFFKDRHILTIDSKSASLGLGMLVREAVRMRDAGESIAHIERRLHEMQKHISVFISLETIENLVRGGRLSKSRGFISKLLKVNPVLSFDDKGKVISIAKGIGANGALDKSIDLVLEKAHGKKHVTVAAVYTNDASRADYAKQKLLSSRPDITVEVTQVSPVLGTYGGNGCVALIVHAE
jgi:uncharacterized protein